MTKIQDPQVADHVASIPLADLAAHPMNPRRKGKAASLDSLVESLRAQGQLEPIIVRTMPQQGGFEILAGHRRVEALRILKVGSAQAINRGALDDAEALAVLLAANEQREDVDPFLEAEAVKALVASMPGTNAVKEAAARLGQPARWVAQRLALLDLSPTWKERRGDEPWDQWTPAHWAVLARLAPDAQEAIAKEGDKPGGGDAYVLNEPNPSIDELEALVASLTRVLGQAPFDILDEKLCRGTPACRECPKTSIATPGLFDEGVADGDLKKATCRDGYCWARKAGAALKRTVEDTRLKIATGDATKVPVVVKGHGAPPKGTGPVVRSGDWTPSKEGAKDAVPVVIVDEKGAVTSGFAKVHDVRASSAGTPVAPRPVKEKTPAEALALLEADHKTERELAIERHVVDAMGKHGPKTLLDALALVLLVGSLPEGSWGEAKKASDASRAARAALAERMLSGAGWKDAEFVALVTPGIREAVEVWFDDRPSTDVMPVLTATGKAIGLKPDALLAVADKVKPKPELLAARARAQIAAAKPAAAPAGKKKAPKPKAAAAPKASKKKAKK